jgi:hypothetical protein
MAVCGTAKALPFPFVLDHSSGVGRRGKPRLYSTFFCNLYSRALPSQASGLRYVVMPEHVHILLSCL